MDQPDPLPEWSKPLSGGLQCLFVEVETDHDTAPFQPAANLFRVPSPADGPINVDPRPLRHKQIDGFVTEHRLMVHTPLFLEDGLCDVFVAIALGSQVFLVQFRVPDFDPFKDTQDQDFVLDRGETEEFAWYRDA